ncbi:PilX N-terminal domain-containing pilus assembly protein [Microbulbifer bruguierae]|uniref:PilX N-terminal domain-containing pilus assembly protein n=1 Tax=Microbulbifer bruguierae TaxID=3029061 RepID=A0ABY8NGY4_9GAMM|nr:PilX N-terminal domain-containing pilus assembly protein [Microbulbifer bruguierae]WGL18194.1 PilX N-terminal domain-containing pilus assembly protein [Microbulbifer bruguierae]
MASLRKQQGAVLVISLIVLLILTMIGMSAARTVLLQEKMTFASRDAKVALEVAEAVVKQAEAYVEGLSTTGDFGTASWLHVEGEGPDSLLDTTTWDNTNSREFEVEMLAADGTSKMKGRAYIELAGEADKEDPANDIVVGGYGQSTGGGEIKVFRIVALGVGISETTTRTIVSHYGKRF